MGKHTRNGNGRRYGDGKPGYKNIDVKFQWRKGGPSPNPSGRKKKKPAEAASGLGPIDMAEALAEAASALITVQGPNGETIFIPAFKAMAQRMIIDGVNDGTKALKVIDLIQGQGLTKVREPEADDTEADEEIARDHARRLARSGQIDAPDAEASDVESADD